MGCIDVALVRGVVDLVLPVVVCVAMSRSATKKRIYLVFSVIKVTLLLLGAATLIKLPSIIAFLGKVN